MEVGYFETIIADLGHHNGVSMNQAISCKQLIIPRTVFIRINDCKSIDLEVSKD